MFKKRIVLKFNPEVSYGLDIVEEYLVSHKDAVRYAIKQEFTVKEGDTYCFLPDVSIPRFKLKAFTDKAKIKTTRSTESADYIFISTLPRNKNVSSLSNQEVTYINYCQMYDAGKNALLEVLAAEFPEFAEKRLELIDKTAMFEILLLEKDVEQIQEFIREKKGKYKWLKYGYTSGEIVLSLKSPKLLSKLRHQDEILSQVNADAIIITDEKKTELQAMFDSKQDDNIILAMEIMANSNYEESILNNYILLTDNRSRIANQRSSGHRNFQGFLMFYGLDIRYLGNVSTTGVESIAGLLKEYGKLTKDNLKKLLMYYAEHNSQHTGEFCNNVLVPNPGLDYDEHE
jgi:hypothetical protein